MGENTERVVAIFALLLLCAVAGFFRGDVLSGVISGATVLALIMVMRKLLTDSFFSKI